MTTNDMDPVWEGDIYSKGLHLNRYPFDCVVSFVYRWHPRDKPRAAVGIVEIGCGAGNNLWFAAREGFQVAGIDGSESAIAHARRRFEQDGLKADLRVGSFTKLPWADGDFDMAIDRGSLVCVNRQLQQQAVSEVHRVLRLGGVFFCNVYGDRSTSAHCGVPLADGRVSGITEGTLVGAGSLCFSSRGDVEALFRVGWDILKLEHLDLDDVTSPSVIRHSEWRVIARKR